MFVFGQRLDCKNNIKMRFLKVWESLSSEGVEKAKLRGHVHPPNPVI